MKNNFGIDEKILFLLRQEIAKFKDVERATIFGSRALGHYRAGSDVDIAI